MIDAMAHTEHLDGTLHLIHKYGLNFRLAEKSNNKEIRFSLPDILDRQRQIISLWRELNKNNFCPAAKTLLGRIASISINFKYIH
jgi:hypothetical protein